MSGELKGKKKVQGLRNILSKSFTDITIVMNVLDNARLDCIIPTHLLYLLKKLLRLEKWEERHTQAIPLGGFLHRTQRRALHINCRYEVAFGYIPARTL